MVVQDCFVSVLHSGFCIAFVSVRGVVECVECTGLVWFWWRPAVVFRGCAFVRRVVYGWFPWFGGLAGSCGWACRRCTFYPSHGYFPGFGFAALYSWFGWVVRCRMCMPSAKPTTVLTVFSGSCFCPTYEVLVRLCSSSKRSMASSSVRRWSISKKWIYSASFSKTTGAFPTKV